MSIKPDFMNAGNSLDASWAIDSNYSTKAAKIRNSHGLQQQLAGLFLAKGIHLPRHGKCTPNGKLRVHEEVEQPSHQDIEKEVRAKQRLQLTRSHDGVFRLSHAHSNLQAPCEARPKSSQCQQPTAESSITANVNARREAQPNQPVSPPSTPQHATGKRSHSQRPSTSKVTPERRRRPENVRENLGKKFDQAVHHQDSKNNQKNPASLLLGAVAKAKARAAELPERSKFKRSRDEEEEAAEFSGQVLQFHNIIL